MEVLKAVADRRRTHDDVILLCVGQPSTPAPTAVLDAAAETLQRDVLGYTEATGTQEFRAAIAGHYADQYRLEVGVDEVIGDHRIIRRISVDVAGGVRSGRSRCHHPSGIPGVPQRHSHGGLSAA